MHFGISKGMRELKYGSCPWLGMDIFWNRPLSTNQSCIYLLFIQNISPFLIGLNPPASSG